MSTETDNWIDICPAIDIPSQGSRIVKTPNGCVALFKTAAGDIFALNDECPHKKGPLSQGIVHDKYVTCPLHAWVFSLETGEAQGADEGRVTTFAIRIVNDRVEINLTAIEKCEAA